MTLSDVYSKFPRNADCIKFLEKVLWNDRQICPYCKSLHNTKAKNEQRYHCNTCNTTYSVTVGTIFHRSRIDLRRWFFAIYLIASEDVNIRELAKAIGVSKDTAWRMSMRIKEELKQVRGGRPLRTILLSITDDLMG